MEEIKIVMPKHLWDRIVDEEQSGIFARLVLVPKQHKPGKYGIVVNGSEVFPGTLLWER